MCVMFAYVQNCVLLVLGSNCECVDGTSTKRDIENPFLGTQMFVQAKKKEYKYDKGTKNVLNNSQN